MRLGECLPDNQAEVVFTDAFTEQLERLDRSQAEDVLIAVVRLCEDPAGTHPLHAPLTGWNTLEVLRKRQRVVYRASVKDGVGLIDVICLGPRTNSEVYDTVEGLHASGQLDDETLTEIWTALELLDVVAEEVGLDGWDYLPPPAPDGMRRAAVASGALPQHVAEVLSKDELEAALEAAWGPDGLVDLKRAVEAALLRSRGSRHPDFENLLSERTGERCAASMPRAKSRCIRRQGHPGPHRSK